MWDYEIFIIGGGINGAAIAADAASRKLRTALCEQHDFASATSSASSKLIHGGLRYLEQYDFKLVKESLYEREMLLKRAPHLVHPLPFIMPDAPQYHSPWMIQAGLWIYDYLARSKLLPRSKRINLANLSDASQLQHISKGFTYYDCWGDDARLVIANLQLAQQQGATIMPRTTFKAAQPLAGGGWRISLQHQGSTKPTEITSKIIINASGPWADKVQQQLVPQQQASHLRLVKGSHIVINKFYQGEHAFILQNYDGRVVFLIPFLQHYLIVGTTDIPFEGDPTSVKITREEIDYLCQVIQRYFKHSITPAQICWQYSGVRPLYNDNQANVSKITRDFVLELNQEYALSPSLTVYGGKLTTHRRLAEAVVNRLAAYFPHMVGCQTTHLPLAGGNIGALSWQQFCLAAQQQYSWLPATLLQRYLHTYGSAIHALLEGKQAIVDLGQYFGADLYEAEIRYLVSKEWAMTAEDVLWRRTKLGLNMQDEENNALASWLRDVYSISS
jgi:glycerol-3-phosphate dehydrogenase